jgi:hypothetical protein
VGGHCKRRSVTIIALPCFVWVIVRRASPFMCERLTLAAAARPASTRNWLSRLRLLR